MELFSINKIKDIKYKTYKKRKIQYINMSIGFDIETSSMRFSSGEKVAFSYIWTLGFEDDKHVYHGRTLEEFKEVCEELQKHFKLSSDKILVIYIHNLPYEFQFIKKYFKWDNVFASEKGKPMKATTTIGIEFRDSYILSGFNLGLVAKNLTTKKIEKLKGDLDYSLIRHSKTVITEEELKYCINDVLIIIYYIQEQIDMYGNITKIPLTNTGRVRQFVRDKCLYTSNTHSKSNPMKRKRFIDTMSQLTLKEEEYAICKKAFMGGFTHANSNKVNQVIEEVTSIDFTSSYPSVMVTEKFPMSKPILTEFTEEYDFDYYRKHFGLVCVVTFKGLVNNLDQDSYLSEHKCEIINGIIDNGRVFSADELTTTITDIDYEIIENVYSFESVEFKEVYRFNMGYLPKDIILSVIELYEKKTTLKDVKGKEAEYMVSKGMLNSMYGMTVTDVIRDEILYIDEWIEEVGDYDKQLEVYNNSQTRFLYYPWGVWVTAYSRRNLWTGIFNIGEDYIYSDTDSIKFTNYEKHKPYIDRYNKNFYHKLEVMCKTLLIDIKRFSPKTIKGVEKPIGVWDYEGTYKRFKTLGAKRYMVEFENNEIEITIAGLSKRNGVDYMISQCNDNTEVFEMFNDNLTIPKEFTGKMEHYYIDKEYSFNCVDYLGVETKVVVPSGIHLESIGFTLSMSKQYIDFLEKIKQGFVPSGYEFIV